MATGAGAIPSGNPDALYKGHKIWIEYSYEYDDNKKAEHYVQLLNGEIKRPDISPYDGDTATIAEWIDAGYPEGRFTRTEKEEFSDGGFPW